MRVNGHGVIVGNPHALYQHPSPSPPPAQHLQYHNPHPHHHYSVSRTPSVAPSSTASTGGGGSGGSSIRYVRLVRRHGGESYGFSLRGGREHGTGFFVSHVEPGSEAHAQGLRAGDQILRLNNLCVEQAVHKEVAAMVQNKNSLYLKVKSAGIIPIKEHWAMPNTQQTGRRGDPLTWLVVDDDAEDQSDNVPDNFSQSLPASSLHDESYAQSHASTSLAGQENYARVFLSYSHKTGLGCSICKGPPERPGIFVQTVKVGGVAKAAGLRPGDQILACNEIEFTDLDFAEAVYVLKASNQLILEIARGAGLDLVAGESSGYNSSASSVAGDQTPPPPHSSSSASSSSASHPAVRHPRDAHEVASRLSAVSRHLLLDRGRGWREIEEEWADAEVAEKRQQLHQNQKALRTRGQRDTTHHYRHRSGSGSACASSGGLTASRSVSNLTNALREDEERTSFRDPTSSSSSSGHFCQKGTATARSYGTASVSSRYHYQHHHHRAALRASRSVEDITSEGADHKIALLTSAEPNVNNIVVTGPDGGCGVGGGGGGGGGGLVVGGGGDARDEMDAVLRLDQLSCPPSQVSTLTRGLRSKVTVSGSHSGGEGGDNEVARQLEALREEQRKLREEANRLAEERRLFEQAAVAAAAAAGDEAGEISEAQGAQAIQDKVDAYRRNKDSSSAAIPDPKRAQHEQLMEEFRRAHRRMFNSREDLTTEDAGTTIMTTRTSPLVKSKPWSERSGGLTSSPPSSASPSSPARPSSFAPSSSSSSFSNSLSNSSSMSSSSLNLASARANLKPLSDSAAAAAADKTSLKEFSVTDGPQAIPRPPEAYFEQPKSGKPNVLVSIGTYPTANQRPAPQKMDFLPKGAQNPPQNSRVDPSGSIAHLQNELSQTLDRSNLRQRCVPLELPAESLASSTNSTKATPSTSSPSSTSSSSTSSVTSATSLSSKYRGLGSEAAAVAAAATGSSAGGINSSSSGSARPSVTINIKGNDEHTTQGPASSSSSPSSSSSSSHSSSPSYSPSVESESPPGILKGRGTPSKNSLHKTISFGDVTTVNDDSIRL
ncbi:uncharacterized protein LOC143032754 isoform X7 [Oratosquilla oratoria]|uniref:uncharacterized protein LOC143032754 isoform X7 n=1 Tax=Oratosquilla oratoria TaxID=337810 RepID=UPI003F76A1C3